MLLIFALFIIISLVVNRLDKINPLDEESLRKRNEKYAKRMNHRTK